MYMHNYYKIMSLFEQTYMWLYNVLHCYFNYKDFGLQQKHNGSLKLKLFCNQLYLLKYVHLHMYVCG